MQTRDRKTDRDRLRLGVIGCGWIWSSIYSPLLALLKDRCRVVAFCDIRRQAAEKAAEAFPGAGVCAASEELFDCEVLDGVMVLTSETANAPTTMRALEAGIPVYLEKPPAVSVNSWARLAEVEADAAVSVFTAFNRRFTPLFREWKCPGNPSRIRGVMSRRGRAIETFPYTAVHLIDSAQYFTGRKLVEATVAPADMFAGWRIAGRMDDGLECDLTFIPDGEEHCEYLVVECAGQTWEMHFPNPDSHDYPEGRLIRGGTAAPVGGAALIRQDDPLEMMGYAPCFRAFLDRLEGGENSSHILEHSYYTIGLLEKMLAKSPRSAVCPPLAAAK